MSTLLLSVALASGLLAQEPFQVTVRREERRDVVASVCPAA